MRDQTWVKSINNVHCYFAQSVTKLKGLYGLEMSEFGISDRLKLTEVTFRIYHMCSFLTN